MNTLTLHSTKIHSIPVLEMYPAVEQRASLRPLPLVIVFHGFDSSKERKLQNALAIAQQGVFVVMPDAVRHGEREDSTFAALTYNQKAESLFDIITETAAEIDSIIQHYSQSSIVDSSRCGLEGTSMGGMIVYEYLARYGREGIRAAVSIISTPDFGSIIDNSKLQNPEFYQSYPQSKINRVKGSQPLPQALKLRDFPLLLLNSEDDTIIPILPVRTFHTSLTHQYTDARQLRMKTFRDTGHQTTQTMIRESAEWFQRWL
ncbi:MAG: alpha/beta hydrolase [Spirochaetaceae bacterium]|nr:alpha/beta hydrolase [Spirochaetaceae bacterium]MCF7947229.1 alpha/beta hydrolase [Spirochaetia bacterium]